MVFLVWILGLWIVFLAWLSWYRHLLLRTEPTSKKNRIMFHVGNSLLRVRNTCPPFSSKLTNYINLLIFLLCSGWMDGSKLIVLQQYSFLYFKRIIRLGYEPYSYPLQSLHSFPRIPQTHCIWNSFNLHLAAEFKILPLIYPPKTSVDPVLY